MLISTVDVGVVDMLKVCKTQVMLHDSAANVALFGRG